MKTIAIEDIALGYLAKERDSHSKSTDYLDIEKVEGKINLNFDTNTKIKCQKVKRKGIFI